MRLTMQMIIVCLLVATSFLTQANERWCVFRGDSIPLGKSVFVKDPTLVKRGLPRDWQGYVIRCTRVVLSAHKTKNPDGVDGVVELGRPVLVISELHEKFYLENNQ